MPSGGRAMNTKIDFKALAAELAALERQGKGHGEDLLIARVLHNMSPTKWAEFCKAYPASNWGAIPVSSLSSDHLEKNIALMGQELRNAVCAEKFTEEVGRELLRMARVGGELSLICTELQNATPELDELMVSVLRKNLETCDSLASDTTGRPLLLLPGTGPVRSRHLAEQFQKDFEAEHSAHSNDAHLVLGVVSIAQGEKATADELVQKVHDALHLAFREHNRLYQFVPEALDERSTLVHSEEKRFLFFGG